MTHPRLLSGKTAIVTGAARRIGKSIALALAERGANVAITYLGSQPEAEETVRALADHEVEAMAIRSDIRDPLDISNAVASVIEDLGSIDILVNNAGLYASLPLEEITAAEWDTMFAVNTRGPFLMAQACLPHLRATQGRGGRIVNIGSLGGSHPWATHAHYCTSKAALHMLSQTMSKAWAPEVSVNCVAPGMIVQSDGEVDSAYQHFAARTPMKRNGTSADVAAAVLFFATAPSFITGQLLTVDGGLGMV